MMTIDFTDNTVLELTPTFRFQWEEVQDCFVVLYPEGMVKLSQSAGEIMKRIDGETSIVNMITEISNTFNGADVKQDVFNFLEEAHAKGWIRSK